MEQTNCLFLFQVWRFVTTFLFFGTFGFNFFFNMIFTYRYCRMLEENSFRGRTADFVFMFIFGSVCMILFAFFVNLLFLGKVKENRSNCAIWKYQKGFFFLARQSRVFLELRSTILSETSAVYLFHCGRGSCYGKGTYGCHQY